MQIINEGRLPELIVVELTYRCNLRCKMCWWWGDNGIIQKREDLHDELSTDDWRCFIESVSWFHPHIRISGGEPFIRPDLPELVDLIRAKSMPCSIITNGVMCDRTSIRQIVEAGVSQVTFSLHGDRYTDGLVRGGAAFDMTLAAIQMFENEKRSLRLSTPRILLNCVISPWNAQGLRQVVQIGRDFGVPVRLQHLMWYEEEVVKTHIAEIKRQFGLDDLTLVGFSGQVPRLDSLQLINILRSEGCIGVRGSDKRAITLPPLDDEDVRNWYANSRYCRGTGCEYVSHAARIKANGEVIACPLINYSFGNVRARPFADLFLSSAALQFRAIVSRKLFPGCARCCKLVWPMKGVME